jgi:DNA modification methylase
VPEPSTVDLDARREWLTFADLKPHPRNYNSHPPEQIDHLAASIGQYGYYRNIVIARDGTILAGHGVVEAGKQAGREPIPCERMDLDPDSPEALKLVALDNEVGRFSVREDEALTALLREIQETAPLGLLGTGFTDKTLSKMIADVGGGVTRDAGPGPVPEKPRTEVGDLWVLGEHRLLCGDATNADDVRRALDGRLADLVWTDPPYGVSYTGGTGLTIAGDESVDVGIAGLKVAAEQCRPGAAWWVATPSGPNGVPFSQALLDLGIYRQQIIWLKDRFVLGHGDFHLRHESLLYGWSDEEGGDAHTFHNDFAEAHEWVQYGWSPGAPHTFNGNRKHDSVFEFPRPSKSKEHPTMKPVELVEHCLRLTGNPGDVVLDPFTGSGTTLIAAVSVGMRAALLEVDPRYCDVIVDRWERTTGGTATR